MADTLYCEILTGCEYAPGVYRFEEDAWGNRTKLIRLSHWVIQETAYEIVWLKNRFKPTFGALDQDDLKQFMWDKLRAKNIN